MKVIAAEWASYPRRRTKQLGDTSIECGLERLLDQMQRRSAGLDYEVRVIVNHSAPTASESGPNESILSRLQSYVQRDNSCDDWAWYASLMERYPFVESVQLRSNSSMDLGAYDFGYQQLLKEGYTGEVLFINSSVRGPFEDDWLLKYRTQFHRHPNAGLCGISLNSHDTSDEEDSRFAPHVQSFLWFTNMSVLSSAMGKSLLPTRPQEKLEVIREGEIGVSTKVLRAGYGITCSMFPCFYYQLGRDWTIPQGDVRFEPGYESRANAV